MYYNIFAELLERFIVPRQKNLWIYLNMRLMF